MNKNLENEFLNLKKELEINGFFHNATVCSQEEFLYIASLLGSCELFCQVNIVPDSRAYIHQSNAIPLHSDYPLIKYIGWYCKQQDDQDGASILSDGYKALAEMSQNELSTLEKSLIFYPNIKLKKHEETMVLKYEFNKKILYYAPWLIRETSSNQVLSNFNQKINANAFSIRLNRGEILFIDNQRMLHGRNQIHKNSQRLLERVWVK